MPSIKHSIQRRTMQMRTFLVFFVAWKYSGCRKARYRSTVMTISVLTSPAMGINRAPTYNLHGRDSHVMTSEKSKIRAIVTNEINRSAVKRKNRVLFDISILKIFTSLQIIWVKCIPLSLRSKKRRRATPLRPLLGFTPVDREGRSAGHFPLRQTWRFQLP